MATVEIDIEALDTIDPKKLTVCVGRSLPSACPEQNLKPLPEAITLREARIKREEGRLPSEPAGRRP